MISSEEIRVSNRPEFLVEDQSFQPKLDREALFPWLNEARAALRIWDTDRPHGECSFACDDFIHWLDANHGVEGVLRCWDIDPHNQFVEGIDLELEIFPYDWGDFRNHWVVEIDGHFFDWTARQFDSDAPFPVIMRICDLGEARRAS